MQEYVRVQYAHQDEPYDSIYIEAIDFQEELSKITDPNVKARLFKYQKYLNDLVLHYRQVKLTTKENLQRQNMENEAKEQATSSSSALSIQSKYKGKAILEGPARTHPS